MRLYQRIALITTTALAIAACSNSGELELTGETGEPPTSEEVTSSAEGDRVSAVGAETELGDILVDADGMTLYGFTNDQDGQSSCYGTCAEAWPPVIVEDNWNVGPELDSAIFNTHTREDGTQQLVAGPWPLYRFAEDTVPGDMKGQGSGGVWYVVSAEDGTLIQDEVSGDGDASDDYDYGNDYDYGYDDPSEAGAEDDDEGTVPEEHLAVQIASTELGDVLADGEGFTLYGFLEDADGLPTCEGACADTWPALLVEGEPRLAEELDPDVFTTVEGAEGGTQVVAGDWPLYRLSADGAPGDVKGHGASGIWFAVTPDGSLVGR